MNIKKSKNIINKYVNDFWFFDSDVGWERESECLAAIRNLEEKLEKQDKIIYLMAKTLKTHENYGCGFCYDENFKKIINCCDDNENQEYCINNIIKYFEIKTDEEE